MSPPERSGGIWNNRAGQLSVRFQFAARIEAEHYARAAIWGTLMLWDARE